MSSAAWASRLILTDAQQISGFRCGRSSVDEWLHEKALSSKATVRTTLYLDAEQTLIAFAATTTTIVEVSGATSAQRANSRDGRAVGFLLAQMGVRHDLAGKGIGGAVLRDAMRSAARMHEEAPFSLFVVDAADESLVEYYRRAGLVRLGNQLRLATPMRKIKALVNALDGEVWGNITDRNSSLYPSGTVNLQRR
ncbi:hypothetical protein ASD19_09755 [Microbacterium sp. Root53]|uniref:hypothetical protein n=1 Tax=Microbacterium sp. Root53 TaxID=1736553 RepID=UPI0006FFC413|nr:hypothetical protein [Microbacterium sp. Root53]KQY96825.1 hypothetical protein ASD19_09755 [Microbacterium sp. Root53]